MKKLIMVAIVALGALSVNAQKGTWYLGTSGLGTIANDVGVYGPMTGVVSTDYKNTGTDLRFGLAPEAGYFVDDNFAVGLGVFYTFSKFSPDADGAEDEKCNTFGVNPYARYYFLNSGNFRLYGQLGFVYSSSDPDIDNADSTDYLEFAVRPGISYNVSDRFAINATFGALGYSQEKEGDYKESTFGLNLDMSSLRFGFTVSF